MSKGQITIAVVSAAGAVFAAFLTANATITDRLNATAVAINSNISSDRERIATVEEAVRTMKASQVETQKDVKEILRLLK